MALIDTTPPQFDQAYFDFCWTNAFSYLPAQVIVMPVQHAPECSSLVLSVQLTCPMAAWCLLRTAYGYMSGSVTVTSALASRFAIAAIRTDWTDRFARGSFESCYSRLASVRWVVSYGMTSGWLPYCSSSNLFLLASVNWSMSSCTLSYQVHLLAYSNYFVPICPTHAVPHACSEHD